MRRRLTVLAPLLLLAAALINPAIASAQEKSAPAISASAEDLRALANTYAELQEYRTELACLKKIESLSIADYRKHSIKHLDALLDALEKCREKKSATEDYLAATEQAFHRELRFFRKASDSDISAERAGWIGVRRAAIEAKIRTTREREMTERKRLGLP